eukprot:GHVN01087499.1.p1 GENE.GHVN01087499.1~~GHVN01087499.1.p1  ORF type:complete len:187 (+),score=9.09 GHVN01087499.1:440-1000(+)
MDDDYIVPPNGFKLGFESWKLAPYRLHGFTPRLGRKSMASKQFKYSSPKDGVYNIVLTGGLFVHLDYLYRYTYTIPAKLREHVKASMNCEDLLMQFTVPPSFHPPVWIRPQEKEKLKIGHFSLPPVSGSKTKGLHTRRRHYIDRAQCLHMFAEELEDSLVLTKWIVKRFIGRPNWSTSWSVGLRWI